MLLQRGPRPSTPSSAFAPRRLFVAVPSSAITSSSALRDEFAPHDRGRDFTVDVGDRLAYAFAAISCLALSRSSNARASRWMLPTAPPLVRRAFDGQFDLDGRLPREPDFGRARA
jgi:hypothetical protein